MEYSLTIFKGIWDKKTDRTMTFDSWDRFERLLHDLSEKPAYKPKKGEWAPNGSPLISPAIFIGGGGRANRNVECWGGWAALDVDSYDGTWTEAMEVFRPYRHICYSSASSTEEKPKFRIVLPLAERVRADKIRHFWHSLNTEFNSLGDKQTKDLCRMYYVPGRYPGAFHFIMSNKDGVDVDPSVLMAKHSWVDPLNRLRGIQGKLPTEILEKLAKYKRENLENNRNFSWTGLSDCPFVSRRQIAEYGLITDTGWYAKLYAFMVSVALSAMKKGYPISATQIGDLARELDRSNGSWYEGRDVDGEALRAIEYASTII